MGMMISNSLRFRALGLREKGVLLCRGSERATLQHLFLARLICADESNYSIALSRKFHMRPMAHAVASTGEEMVTGWTSGYG